MAVALKVPASEPQRFYLPELDSLRFIAFFMVFLGHGVVISGLWGLEADSLRDATSRVATVGSFGVDLFFVLSAYLLTELMLREKEARGSLNVTRFYLRRLLRIWPLYYGALAVALIVGGNRGILISFALFVGNFAMMAWEVGPGLGTLWSISVEEQFYLFWPLIVRDYSREKLTTVAVRLWVIAIVGRLVLLLMGTPVDALWANTLSHFDALACGILLSATGVRSSRRGTLIALGVALWIAGTFLISTRVGIVLTYSCVGVGAAALLLATLGTQLTMMHHPALVYLGRISYGLYVLHVPVLILTRKAVGSSSAWPLCLVIALAATIAGAAVSYRFYERPFLSLKRRFEILPSRPI